MEAVVTGSAGMPKHTNAMVPQGVASAKASKCAPSTLSRAGGPSDHCRLLIEVEIEEKHS